MREWITQIPERRRLPGRRNHKRKDLEVKPILVCLRDRKWPAWLELSEKRRDLIGNKTK